MLGPASALDLASRLGCFDPLRIPAVSASLARWGPTPAAPYAAAAISTPRRAAVIDDDGEQSFRDLDRASTQLAQGLRARGVGRGSRIGIACRNHRGFVETVAAAAKLGAPVVYLNTGFAGPQLNDVIDREEIHCLVVDADRVELVDQAVFGGPIVVVGTVPEALADDSAVESVEQTRRAGSSWPPLIASLPAAPVLLTSGTTGTPKGARRSVRVDPGALGVLERIPYRHDDVFAITSPLFHAWGLAQLGVASALGATVVLSERFDPADVLAQIEREQVTVLAVVPVILQRLLAVDDFAAADLRSLRIVVSSGARLPVPVVEEWLERVGPNLYNFYGSTEVGQATLAEPSDLVVDPATAGQVLRGSTVAVLDETGEPVAAREVGRIFVGNGSQFDGYTGGGGKEIVGGLMASGDVGYLDAAGRLFVTGRADDMIVSGGENVFPREVEDLLLAHPDIADVAVVGVPDDEFGQRLAAHVVVVPGARLSAAVVQQLVAAELARHKVPRDVIFVAELPRTTTGKVRRTEL